MARLKMVAVKKSHYASHFILRHALVPPSIAKCQMSCQREGLRPNGLRGGLP